MEKDRIIDSEYYVIPEESNIGFIAGINRKYIAKDNEAEWLALVFNDTKFKKTCMITPGYTKSSLHYRDNSAYDKYIIYNGCSLKEELEKHIQKESAFGLEIVGSTDICKITLISGIDERYMYIIGFNTIISKDDTVELIDSTGNKRDLTYEYDVHTVTSGEDMYSLIINEIAIYIKDEKLYIVRPKNGTLV